MKVALLCSFAFYLLVSYGAGTSLNSSVLRMLPYPTALFAPSWQIVLKTPACCRFNYRTQKNSLKRASNFNLDLKILLNFTLDVYIGNSSQIHYIRKQRESDFKFSLLSRVTSYQLCTGNRSVLLQHF